MVFLRRAKINSNTVLMKKLKFPFIRFLPYYESLSKVFQYLGNMNHNLPAPDDVMKMTNHTELTWYSLILTCQICFDGLKHNLGIYSFRPTWPCPIVEFLATWVKFLQPSSYCNAINCTFICAAFKSHMEWSNAHISTPTTTILPTTVGTFHCLNCFDHMYMSQTSMYKNIAKLLTLPSVSKY